jgi:TonB family protein
VIPPSVYPPILRQGKVSIEFLVRKDGHVAEMKLHSSSGDVSLDRAAWASITASSPFHALPEQFPGDHLGLRFHFYYNLEVIRLGVSPCVDVRVPVGSAQQFSASGKDITNASVTWSLHGSSCSKSACGTISESGLYTAPSEVPTPATVVVEATSRTDTGLTGGTKLTIFPATSPH